MFIIATVLFIIYEVLPIKFQKFLKGNAEKPSDVISSIICDLVKEFTLC